MSEVPVRIAVVLAGAVAKGAYEAGVLHELVRANVKIVRIVAASSGALNGTMLAASVRARNLEAGMDKLVELWRDAAGWTDVFSPKLRLLRTIQGVSDNAKVLALLRSQIAPIPVGEEINLRLLTAPLAGITGTIGDHEATTYEALCEFTGADFATQEALDRVFAAATASSAFPLEFAPVEVPGLGPCAAGGAARHRGRIARRQHADRRAALSRSPRDGEREREPRAPDRARRGRRAHPGPARSGPERARLGRPPARHGRAEPPGRGAAGLVVHRVLRAGAACGACRPGSTTCSRRARRGVSSEPMKGLVALLALCVACGSPTRGDDGFGTGDANGGSGSGSGSGDAGTVYVYAHTESTLYKVDPDTLAITKIGDFAWPSFSDSMTDLAIDKTGQMIGVSFTSVYRVDPTNAHTTLLTGNLQGMFNGLSFVPADQLGQTGDDVLIGTRNTDGKVFRVDPATGATTLVGDMGAAFMSSGGLVAVAGFGTVQTILGFGADKLARLAPQTFAAPPIGRDTGV